MLLFNMLAVPLGGKSLVEASAGTGKTYALSTLLVRLLLEQELTIDQILVVTFTEAATAELKHRVRERLRETLLTFQQLVAVLPGGPTTDPVLVALAKNQAKPVACMARLEAALNSFDDAGIFTIHGFCHRTLQENAFFSGVPFEAELLKDTRPLVEEVLQDYWSKNVSSASLMFVERLRKPGQQLTVDGLRSFANWVSQTPQLRVLPEARCLSDSPDTQAFLSAFNEAKALYDPNEIEQLLLGAGLHGNKYRKASIPKWCDTLRQYFDAKVALPQVPENFEKFTSDALQAASPKVPLQHAFFDACDALLAVTRQFEAELEQQVLTFLQNLVAYVQREVPARKERRGVLSFDDLLTQLHYALHGPSGSALSQRIRSRFRAALIDEFQDTDPLQYAIFEKIYARSPNSLFLIGDPKQAIYSFRGADVFAYLGAAASVNEARRYTMAVNYRSDPELVTATNALFVNSPVPFFISEITFPEVSARNRERSPLQVPEELGQEPFQVRFLKRPTRRSSSNAPAGEVHFDRNFKSKQLPMLVAREVADLLNSEATLGSRRLTPKDFAVLTRTNAEAFECQRALQELRIPSVVQGDRSVYEYEEASQLQLLLGAVLEPGNARAIRAALTTEMFGVSADLLLALDHDDAAWDRWVERFRGWNQRWAGDGFVQMIRQVMQQCQVAERLLGLVDGERRMTNLLHLVELLHTASATLHLGPSGLFQFLASQRSREFASKDSEQIRLESDEDAVVLTTIHKSKGLEYAVVICPTLFSGMLVHPGDRNTTRFHATDDAHALTLDLGTPSIEVHRELMREEALAENLRLLYVALTRARHRTVVFWGAFRGYNTSALGYLLHAEHFLGKDGHRRPSISFLEDYLKSRSDDALFERLQELQARAPAIGIEQVDQDRVGERFLSPGASTQALSCRAVAAPIRRWQRTASFTELSSSDAPYQPLDEGRDIDAGTDVYSKGARTGEERIFLADFPGGAKAGNFFHDLLEHLDFQVGVTPELIQATLRAHGFEDQNLEGTVARSLEQILSTELASGLSLAKLSNTQRLNELEFYLPAGLTPKVLDRASLGRVFRDHPSAAVEASYCDELLNLTFAALSGYLKGFIDLVFVHAGRYYLADYKTNNLGETYADYSMPQLKAAMAHSHYYLQYHLYSLALDRYLQQRVQGYDYDTHFGGVYYLFVRGMAPQFGAEFGVFYEKPPLTRLSALSIYFEAPPAVAQERTAS